MHIAQSRRSFLRQLSGLCSACALPDIGQQRQRNPLRRIGFLIGDAPPLLEAFKSEMRALGYIEGQNLFIDVRTAAGPEVARHAIELAKADLELVVAGALPFALEIRKADPALPMVIATCPGMISNGFAKTLERPGGNVTGMEELPPGVTEKRLTLLKAAVPRVTRVALLSTTPGVGGHEAQMADAERTAKSLGIEVKAYRAANLAELKAALDRIAADRMNGLLNFQGGLSLANRQMITDFAAVQRIPAIYQATMFAEADGLMTWAPDLDKQYRIAASYVDQILKGAKAGDLPIRHPDRYFLTINARAAERIGLTLPPDFIAAADRVIR
jgi:putative ABC transport system substrate-binding protein